MHYLLEPGWRADAAIQGLGRSNRTNQKQPPIFRPVATDVKGEKRFLSTIARRLDTLGAITRGQRQTGGQGLFRADDNLESPYAKAALRQFYQLLYAGKVEGCSLTDVSGRDRPRPPRPGRLAAGRAAADHAVPQPRAGAAHRSAEHALRRLRGNCSKRASRRALAAGTYDVGVETLTAESFRVAERRTVHTHAATGAETRCYRVLRKDRNRPLPLADALEIARGAGARLLINEQSHRAAVQAPASSLMDDDGRVEARTRLIRPMARETVTLDEFARSHWREATQGEFAPLWEAECARVPEFSESAFPHHHRPAAADLGPAAGREHARLPLRDRRRRARHRPPGHARGARPRLRRPRRRRGPCPLPRGSLERRHRARRGARSRRRSADPPLAGDGRASRRAHRFLRRRRPQLKALGLTSEIIAWRLRLFVPTAEDRGPAILGALFDRHPLLGTRARAAA